MNGRTALQSPILNVLYVNPARAQGEPLKLWKINYLRNG